jgi:hypothetical protein
MGTQNVNLSMNNELWWLIDQTQQGRPESCCKDTVSYKSIEQGLKDRRNGVTPRFSIGAHVTYPHYANERRCTTFITPSLSPVNANPSRNIYVQIARCRSALSGSQKYLEHFQYLRWTELVLNTCSSERNATPCAKTHLQLIE